MAFMLTTKRKIQVFISYRRKDGAELATSVCLALEKRGFEAFMDVKNLRSGEFKKELHKDIEEAEDFVIVLTPSVLDYRQDGAEDWLRDELTHASQNKKNVIPVAAPGFQWPKPDQWPPDLSKLSGLQSVNYYHDQSEGSIDKLVQLLRARPRKTSWFQIVGIIGIALLIGIWFVFSSYKQPPDSQIRSPAASPNSDVTLDEYVKAKTAADAAWERIKTLDRGSGFGVLLDQAQQQQRVAAEYDKRKADTQASAAYQLLSQMCRNLEERQQVRLKAQASQQEAEDLIRSTDSAFKGGIRPPSFGRGKQALGNGVVSLANGDFELAKVQLAKAVEQFAATRKETEAFNLMTEAQERWITTLAAVDEKVLNKFTAAQFQAAKSKAADAHAKALAGQTDLAMAGFKEATTALLNVMELVKSTKMSVALSTNTTDIKAVSESAPQISSSPSRLATSAKGIHECFSSNNSIADLDKGRFVTGHNRFRRVSEKEVYDEQLDKTWVLYDPNQIMDWETAQAVAQEAGGRLPTLEELKTLFTTTYNPTNWAYVNTDFFPAHKRTKRFWTSNKTYLGGLKVYVDFGERKCESTSGSEHQAVLIIKDK